MLLDAYYKLRFYTTTLMRMARPGKDDLMNLTVAITIPELQTCDGTLITSLSAGASGAAYVGDRTTFSRPLNEIIAQAADIKVASNITYQGSNIIVGSGTTPPTARDYRMEQEITENLLSQSVTCHTDLAAGTITYYKTMTNTSATETVTVTEVGLAEALVTSSTTGKWLLVMRQVLEQPIVAGPGESFTVRITHAFPVHA